MRPLLPILFLCGALAVAGCFGPGEDEDGLSADVEREGYDIVITLVDGSTTTRHVTSDPGLYDTDGDGLSDNLEWLQGTDPRAADSDGDGLLDGHTLTVERDAEVVAAWSEGIVHNETAGGFVFEGERGTEDEPRYGEPLHQDTDGDGLMDGDEVRGVQVSVCGIGRAIATLVHFEDTDGDGLFDGEEAGHGLDAGVRDTDGDGVDDRGDVDPCRDVRVHFSVDTISITDDPESRGARPLWFHVNLPGNVHLSDIIDITTGGATDGAPWSTDSIEAEDAGGDVRAGEHNITFTITALSESASGEPMLIDLFSTDTGSGSLIGKLDVISGALSFNAPGDARAWPSEATFTGAHGTITLSFAPER